MTVEHRTGNLFRQTDLAAIGQGVNLAGVMGSGIAPQFARIWPDMEADYKRACRDRSLTLGGLHAWQAPSGVWIYNIASQQRTGRDARLNAIESGLRCVLDHAAEHNVASIGLPRIGAGIGGLRWNTVLDTINRVAGLHPVRLVCVSLPGA